MARRGNLPALKKAVRANPNMTATAKRKALSTIQKKIARARPKSHRSKPASSNLGVEGFKEASMATVKLVSHPVEQALEGYHLMNGLRKMWKWAKGRSR
jgi:hypothetical protein